MKPRVITTLLIAATTLWLASTGTVSAWGAQGHHVVARIAWALMTPLARERASALLAVQGDQPSQGMDAFVAAATWADDVRQDRPATYNWHFVNIHVSETKYDATRHCPPS